MERRALLALLGVGGATAAAGCSGLLGGDEDDGGEATPEGTTPTATPEPEGLSLDDVQRREREVMSGTSPDPALSYDYGTVEISDVPDPNFERVEARATPDRRADRIHATPGLVSADELAARLRAVWGVGRTEEVEREVDGRSVTFAGGVSGGTAYLVGARPDDGDGVVLVARAASLDTARELTAGFD